MSNFSEPPGQDALSQGISIGPSDVLRYILSGGDIAYRATACLRNIQEYAKTTRLVKLCDDNPVGPKRHEPLQDRRRACAIGRRGDYQVYLVRLGRRDEALN